MHDAGYSKHWVFIKPQLAEDELDEKIAEAHFFIGIRSRNSITEEGLDTTPINWFIGCFCIGTNQVNLEQRQVPKGIVIFNAPFSNTRSVAELVPW